MVASNSVNVMCKTSNYAISQKITFFISQFVCSSFHLSCLAAYKVMETFILFIAKDIFHGRARIDFKGCKMKLLLILGGGDVNQLSAQVVTHDINSWNFFSLICFTISNEA